MVFTTFITLGIGILLCFMGYRSFRIAMTLGGAAVGGYIGHFIWSLTYDSLGGFDPDVAKWLFTAVGAILLGLLSYRIYKAALFYVTMFFTGIFLLQSYLTIAGGHNSATAFVMDLFHKTPLGAVTGDIGGIQVPGGESVDQIASDAISGLTGGNLWLVLAVVAIVSVVIAIVVCAMQRPAIIVATSFYGAMLITRSGIHLYETFSGGTATEYIAPLDSLWQGSNPLWEILLLAGFAVLGCFIQFKTSKK